MDHQRCRRAVWIPSPDAGETMGSWHCLGCGTVLARVERMWLRHEVSRAIVPLEKDHDGLPTFGLPPRTMADGHGSRKRTQTGPAFVMTRSRLPFFVYCPRRSTCGMGQHVDDWPGGFEETAKRGPDFFVLRRRLGA